MTDFMAVELERLKGLGPGSHTLDLYLDGRTYIEFTFPDTFTYVKTVTLSCGCCPDFVTDFDKFIDLPLDESEAKELIDHCLVQFTK